jgi:hypothetical protein
MLLTTVHLAEFYIHVLAIMLYTTIHFKIGNFSSQAKPSGLLLYSVVLHADDLARGLFLFYDDSHSSKCHIVAMLIYVHVYLQ